jgi:hypothetical protein
MTVVRLADDQLHDLAKLIAAELAHSQPAQKLLTADQLASHLGLSRKFVYSHQAELGAVRVGEGAKPRLRFPAPKSDLVERDLPGPAARKRNTKRAVTAGSVLAIRAAKP